MQNKKKNNINYIKIIFNFSNESNLWKHIKLGLVDSLKNKKFVENRTSELEILKSSNIIETKDKTFNIDFDFPTFFKFLNKKKYIKKKKISYVSFYDLKAKKNLIKKKKLTKKRDTLFKLNFNEFFCFYLDKHEYYLDKELVNESIDDILYFFDFYYVKFLGVKINKTEKNDLNISSADKKKIEKKKYLSFLRRTYGFSIFDYNFTKKKDSNKELFTQVETVGEFFREGDELLLSNFSFNHESYIIEYFFNKNIDNLENYIFSSSEPMFGYNTDNIEYEPFELKKRKNLINICLKFLHNIDSESELKKSNLIYDFLLNKQLDLKNNLNTKINEIIKTSKDAFINKNFLGSSFFFLILMSLKNYNFYIKNDKIEETLEEYMKRMKKLVPYEPLSCQEETLENFCEINKKYYHPLYPTEVQVDVVNDHFANKFKKKEPVIFYIKDSFKSKKNKELRANFKKNNKDFFFKKTYINKFNSYFFKKGNLLNTLKDLVSGFSFFLDESLDKNIDEKFRTKNILAFFNMLAASENNININIILAWIIEFNGFIYFFKTKAIPKFLKKKVKKKYLVEPFFVKKEIRNKYTLKYFHFFTEKEQAFNLNDRFFDLLSSTAYDYKESLFFNYKVISLKKAVHKFLKNK